MEVIITIVLIGFGFGFVAVANKFSHLESKIDDLESRLEESQE